jgi:SAF domain
VTSEHPAGAVYFPETDIRPNGTGGGSQPPGRLRGLPRRRRPAMIALAIAMAGAGVVVSAALYQRADHQVPVVMVTADVPAGAVITARDLAITSVTTPSAIRVIPAAQRGQVSGEVAAVPLRAGTLLAPSDLTSAQPPGPGQQLVPVAVKPSVLPASGLFAGDHVLIVATPGDQGEPGSTGTPQLANPVPAVVAAVNTATDASGFDVVDLLVKSADGPAVAEQASTGQFALVVTRRGP